jgi:hypothetical protein
MLATKLFISSIFGLLIVFVVMISFLAGWWMSEYLINAKTEIVCESGTGEPIDLVYGNAVKYDCNGITVVMID